MKKPLIILGSIIIIAGAVVMFFQYQKPIVITTFDECAARYPVMESYPEQCNTPDGKHFVHDIGNELEKTNLIRVSTPRPNTTITSPVTISGEARGFWFFEASFPVKLYDANGTLLAVSPAHTDPPMTEWMTENFVPFAVTLEFKTPTTTTGKLILSKDNPSGLPEHDDFLYIPVRFK